MSSNNTSLPSPARRLVEIRAYKLKPGTRAAFHDAVVHRAMPLVRAYGMDVIAHGPVANDDDGYFVARSFADLAELTAQQDEFYGSPTWREGPREALVSRIETYVDTLLWLSPASIADMRAGNRQTGGRAVPGIADELASLDRFRRQPAQQGRELHQLLKRFMGTRAGRKERYGALLVSALAPQRVPIPLRQVLQHALAGG